MTKYDIAEIAHNTGMLYKAKLKQETIAWWDAPKYVKDSTLASVEYVMNNPNATGEQQHQAWVKYKKDTGWVWGAEIIALIRTHPNMVAYSELPKHERIKAELFTSVVKALLPAQNFLGG